MTKILSFFLMGLFGFSASFAYSQDIPVVIETPQPKKEVTPLPEPPIPKSELAAARLNAADPAAQDAPDFFEQYEKWLPERITSDPPPEGPGPPFPNLPSDMYFSGSGQMRDDPQFFAYGRFFGASLSLYGDRLADYDNCPFPIFIKQLQKLRYRMRFSYVPRYTVFPMLGRFYCIDCPEGKETEREWLTSASRLRPNEEPKDISLQRESIIFPMASKLHERSDGGGKLYGYSIYLRDFVPDTKYPTTGTVKIILRASEGTKRHEAWFKVGDVLEFHDKGHKIINIVMPRMLDEEIRGHKCFLVGYIELDPEPIPLENPHTEEVTPLPEPPVPKSDLAAARLNAANSAALDDPDFFEQYEKWLPERITSAPLPKGPGPPFPNLPCDMEFFGLGQIHDDPHFFAYGRFFSASLSMYGDRLVDYENCPFPEFIKQLQKSRYDMVFSFVPRYTVFPMLGRFYCIDCPEGKDSERRWLTSAFRLRPDEEPTGISLQRESIIFPIASKLHERSDGGGKLYGYSIYLRDFTPDKENPSSGSVKISLWPPEGRKMREAWFKVGDVLEFHDKGHKIINIVMPRMLDEEIRGHKCFLVGYIELDPEPIPLENPHTEEVTPLPEPPVLKTVLAPEETNGQEGHVLTPSLVAKIIAVLLAGGIMIVGMRRRRRPNQ